MKKTFVKISAFATVLAIPAFAFAANQFEATYFIDFLDQLKLILKNVVPLLITVAIIVFFYELIMFISKKKQGDATKAEEARKGLFWSIIALFLMMSFWGVVQILQQITGTGNAGNIDSTDYTIVI